MLETQKQFHDAKSDNYAPSLPICKLYGLTEEDIKIVEVKKINEY
jgi:hypothetical protein